MQRKAITDLISVIILLLITVALAGVAYTFLQGFLFPQVTKSFSIPPGGAYCTVIPGATPTKKIIVYVVNTGYQSTMEDEDFNIIAVDGAVVPAAGIGNINLESGKAEKLIDLTCASGGPCTNPAGNYQGAHTIDLGTVSGVQHISVFCP